MFGLDSYTYQQERVKEECFSVPAWAKVEKLERIIPEKKLWMFSRGKKRRGD